MKSLKIFIHSLYTLQGMLKRTGTLYFTTCNFSNIGKIYTSLAKLKVISF